MKALNSNEIQNARGAGYSDDLAVAGMLLGVAVAIALAPETAGASLAVAGYIAAAGSTAASGVAIAQSK